MSLLKKNLWALPPRPFPGSGLLNRLSLEELVWRKGTTVFGYHPNVWRKDHEGNWIKRREYGNRDSLYGWEMDHIQPRASDGPDELWNLRPLQWQANLRRNWGSRLAGLLFKQ